MRPRPPPLPVVGPPCTSLQLQLPFAPPSDVTRPVPKEALLATIRTAPPPPPPPPPIPQPAAPAQIKGLLLPVPPAAPATVMAPVTFKVLPRIRIAPPP